MKQELGARNLANLMQPKAGWSRRAFLGGSAAATVGSIAVPPFGDASQPVEAGQLPGQQPEPSAFFRSAKPIWPRGREKEMNLSVGFRAAFDAPQGQRIQLLLAGSTLYRVYLNGEFLAWGPARGPHNFFRVDVLDLTRRAARGRNVVAIEVAGYNVNSYYVLDQPSFLQAEVVTDSAVLASTAGDGNRFEARILTGRIVKAQRYSFQRSFSEVYHLEPDHDRWRGDADLPLPAAECTAFENSKHLPRRVPYPTYAQRQPESIAAAGTFRWTNKGPKTLAEDKSVPYGAKISATLHGYPENELTEIPYLQLQKTDAAVNTRVDEPYHAGQFYTLAANDFKILDFGTNLCGFLGARLEVTNQAKFYFVFDETLTNGDIDFTRLMCVNIVAYTLAPGIYRLECFEPYVLRFLKLMVTEGECTVRDVYLREYATPDVWTAEFQSSDAGLNELFAAGRETYRQNSVDFFTDTPSRERAGWLCDSSFTAQVSPLLSGHTLVEQCFFENYLLPESFKFLPDGMIPGCYPADHYNGMLLPNWALWFLLQLEQYLLRSGDRTMVDAMKPRVMKLLDYFKPFENEQGLLEKLQGWVFIEWSKSNDFVQDVSFPSNMLYAAALAAMGRIYDLPEKTRQAEALKKTIRTLSYDGEFFVDNALRQGGTLTPTKNRTETCQYYAFYFDIATAESYPELWETLRTKFGPERRRTGAFPGIAPSNAFMGNVMRIELLSRAGLADQLIREVKAYYLPMAELTGTFWENMGSEASMDHAFGSHVIVHLYRDVLGLERVDNVNKSVRLRFTQSAVESCAGRIPTSDGFISLRWRKIDGSIDYQCDVPAGYTLKVESRGLPAAKARVFPHGKVDLGYRIEGGYK
jgi:alpha-L-rhamnosidase